MDFLEKWLVRFIGAGQTASQIIVAATATATATVTSAASTALPPFHSTLKPTWRQEGAR